MRVFSCGFTSQLGILVLLRSVKIVSPGKHSPFHLNISAISIHMLWLHFTPPCMVKFSKGLEIPHSPVFSTPHPSSSTSPCFCIPEGHTNFYVDSCCKIQENVHISNILTVLTETRSWLCIRYLPSLFSLSLCLKQTRTSMCAVWVGAHTHTQVCPYALLKHC